MKRRNVLKSILLSSSFSACSGWARVHSPLVLAAAKKPEGDYVVVGIGKHAEVLFSSTLPMRGHGMAIHPKMPLAIVFARRPGAIAGVFDLTNGVKIAQLDISDFGHFYGHGVFRSDGRFLYTTENNLESSRGRIGIWDVANGFKRIGEKPTGGIGPHEMIVLPKGGYAVANGGILTDPSFGRKKLNLATMRPSLALLDEQLNIKSQHYLSDIAPHYHQLSIRHMAANTNSIALGLQWEGSAHEQLPVIALFDGHFKIVEESAQYTGNYIGSVAVNARGDFGFSAPKSDTFLRISHEHSSLSVRNVEGIYGLAGVGESFMATTKYRILRIYDNHELVSQTEFDWDNHMLSI